MKEVYRNKKNGKNYQIMGLSKVKIDGNWEECVIYNCLYDNPEGMIWVRLKEDFEDKFEVN